MDNSDIIFFIGLTIFCIVYFGAIYNGHCKYKAQKEAERQAIEDYNNAIEQQAEQERIKAERDKRLASEELKALDLQVDSIHLLINSLDSNIEAEHDNTKKAKLLKQQADLYMRCVSLSNKAERLRDKYDLE